MESTDAIYQLKIKYDNIKGMYGMVFIDSNEVALLNRETILEKVRSITSRFNDSKEEELKIQYLDDEKNFVNLSNDNLVSGNCFVVQFKLRMLTSSVLPCKLKNPALLYRAPSREVNSRGLEEEDFASKHNLVLPVCRAIQRNRKLVLSVVEVWIFRHAIII